MSVIIKSNNVATKSLGTLKMLGTSPQVEFDKYKARVIADGGVVRDEPRTLRAFQSLFDAKMYGNMSSFASGSFGVKLNVDNRVVKVYAIDGSDLIGQVYGTGLLPTLTVDNAIDFGSNTTSVVNGALLTTAEQIKVSKANTYGLGMRIKRHTALSRDRISAFTKHNDAANISQVLVLTDTGTSIGYQTHKDPLSLTTAGTYNPLSGLSTNATTPFILYLSDVVTAYSYGYRDGLFGTSTAGKPAALEDYTFYIDVGGYYRSNAKYFWDGAFYDYISINQATNEQALALSRFN